MPYKDKECLVVSTKARHLRRNRLLLSSCTAKMLRNTAELASVTKRLWSVTWLATSVLLGCAQAVLSEAQSYTVPSGILL